MLPEYLVKRGFGIETRLQSQRQNGLMLLFGITQFTDHFLYTKSVYKIVKIGSAVRIHEIGHITRRQI